MRGFAIQRVERTNYVLAGLLVASTALLGTREQMLGALVGSLVSSINFSFLCRIVPRMGSPEAGQGGAALLLVPKMLGVMAAMTLAIIFLPLSAIMLTVGFSIFLISIGIETARFAMTASEPEEGQTGSSSAADPTQSKD